jgi:basic membrane lipoprotein Med (substrate-binding protein (PBP1-ABC) superfamily)/DNA-binding SARP family transcriptional activator
VDFRILGQLEARRNGTPVELGAPKQRALLAILLLHPGEVVSSDRLIESIWGEHPPRTAAHSIQAYVSELRHAFDGESNLLVTRRPGYALNVGSEHIDARRFEHLVGQAAERLDDDPAEAARILDDALTLWTGTPLSEFEYEDFARRDIEHLEEVHRRAVSILAAALVAQDRPVEAIPLLRDAAAADPLADDVQRLLMVALYRDGRQAEALRSYRSYRRMLAEETGLDPSPELARLEEQILLRQPDVGSVPEPGRVETARNPYKGLRAFGESDAADFFGRDDLIERLLDACRQPMTVVVGPSGSGKSSVVRAGLIPRVRRVAPRRLIVVIKPGHHPFVELEMALSRALPKAAVIIDPEDDQGVLRAVSPLLPPAGMLLVVDQFEEAFALADDDIRRSFLANLVSLARDPRARIGVLLTIRADFYDRPLLHPDFAEAFADNVVNVLPLTPAGIEAAAVEPAKQVGLDVSPELVAQLVADVGDRPGALPLFQYTLTELFERRRGKDLTLEDYDRVGGLVAALGLHAEAVYQSLTGDEQDTARAVFLSLVKHAGDRYVSRPVPVLDLEAGFADAAAVSTVLTRFGEERLLSFDRDPATGAAVCEIAHEALLDAWERLDGWLDQTREDVERMDVLREGAALWDKADRNSDYLLTGSRLHEHELWADETLLPLPPLVDRFIEASLAARASAEAQDAERLAKEHRTARRARLRLWGLFAAVAALVALATFVALAAVSADRPGVVLVYEGPTSGWGAQQLAGVEQAADGFDLDIVKETASIGGALLTLSETAADAPELILSGFGSTVDPTELLALADAHPDIDWVMPDLIIPPEKAATHPNVSFPLFAANEGSFLAGVTAGLTTETGIVGFIGGTDNPVIWEFQTGFEAGVQAVDPGIEILVDYLGAPWDMSGFISPALASEHASELYARGADVVYAAAGEAQKGVADAAHQASEATGVHRWMIGVDTDLYSTTATEETFPDLDYYPERRLPHILTSMLKRTDTAFYAALEDYHQGNFTSGVRRFDLANDGVSLSTSGGHIDNIAPELDRMKQAIISGEIEVPSVPADMEP